MIAAILCGGKGTRLRPVIGEHQKCAVDIGGRPWIHRLLDECAKAGIEKTVLLTGYKAEEIAAAVATRKSRAKMKVELIYSEPTGPADAVRLAFERIGSQELILLNGDTVILDFNLHQFIRSRLGETTIVRSPALLGGVVADAGVAFMAMGTTAIELRTNLPYLDIGTPAGLAEARRRFST